MMNRCVTAAAILCVAAAALWCVIAVALWCVIAAAVLCVTAAAMWCVSLLQCGVWLLLPYGVWLLLRFGVWLLLRFGTWLLLAAVVANHNCCAHRWFGPSCNAPSRIRCYKSIMSAAWRSCASRRSLESAASEDYQYAGLCSWCGA